MNNPGNSNSMETFSSQMKTSAMNQTTHPTQQKNPNKPAADQNNVAPNPGENYWKIKNVFVSFYL